MLAPGLAPPAWAQGEETGEAMAADPLAGEDMLLEEDMSIPAEAEEEPWPSEFFKSLEFSGYLETSYTFGTNSPKPDDDPELRGRIFDTEANEFMLNAFMLNISRPVDEDQWFGFTVTPFLGQDAETTAATGLFDDDESIDLLNAYLEAYVPYTGASVKVGKWETHVGGEVIQGPYNDNFSRSYLFGYAIPFTHMGILATQPILKRGSTEEDMLSIGGGVSNGWDIVDDNNEAKAWHAFAALAPCDYFETQLNYVFSGSEQDDNNSNHRNVLDLVATLKPLPNLKISGNLDWGGEEEGAADGTYANWWGFAGIVRYDFALLERDKKNFFVAFRGEYFDDDDGARLGDLTGTPATTGVDVWEMTFTLGYMPTENLLLRTELRYDRASEDIFFDSHGQNSDGVTPDEDWQTTIAFEAALLF